MRDVFASDHQLSTSADNTLYVTSMLNTHTGDTLWVLTSAPSLAA